MHCLLAADLRPWICRISLHKRMVNARTIRSGSGNILSISWLKCWTARGHSFVKNCNILKNMWSSTANRTIRERFRSDLTHCEKTFPLVTLACFTRYFSHLWRKCSDFIFLEHSKRLKTHGEFWFLILMMDNFGCAFSVFKGFHEQNGRKTDHKKPM